MNYDDRSKLDNFNGFTTYLNDYRIYPPQKREVVKWEKDTKEPPPKKCAEYVKEDHETYRPWESGKHVPFDLLWTPIPILRTNPWTPINKTLKEPVDTGKEEAIKTRPRLYMSPAVSLDDVPDKEMRALLCKNMYTTDWRRAETEAVAYVNMTKREVSDSVLDTGSTSMQIINEEHKPLPEGWRTLSEKWDKKQKRNCVDPTKTFWLHTELKSEENPLGKLVPPETKKEISELIRDNRLRQPHDKHPPGYEGYKVRFAKGVSLAKSDFPVVHPELSVAQAIAKRQKGDANLQLQ